MAKRSEVRSNVVYGAAYNGEEVLIFKAEVAGALISGFGIKEAVRKTVAQHIDGELKISIENNDDPESLFYLLPASVRRAHPFHNARKVGF